MISFVQMGGIPASIRERSEMGNQDHGRAFQDRSIGSDFDFRKSWNAIRDQS